MQAVAAEVVAERSKAEDAAAAEERKRQQSIDRMNRRAGERGRIMRDKGSVPDQLKEQPWERELAGELAREAEALARSGGNKRKAAAAGAGATVGASSADDAPKQVLVMLRADTAGGLEAMRAAFSRMDASV